MKGINSQQELDFFVGNSFFNQNWVTAPASTDARDGLGPFFNAKSCSGCHFKDGRGRAPNYFGELTTGFIIRLSEGIDLNGISIPNENYGTQLQDQSILDIVFEGRTKIDYTIIEGSYDDGEKYYLQKPIYSFLNLNYGPFSPQLLFSPRVAPQMIGLGLIENIKESEILRYEDINDVNSDGISGKANYVWDYTENKLKLGRFGWKANQSSLRQQVASAFIGDMGITSNLFSNQNCTSAQLECYNATTGGNPEISEDNFNKVVLYCQTLAVPKRRYFTDTEVLEGKQLFFNLKCNTCHIQSYTTNINNSIDALSNQRVFPYSDFLLHDMGEQLADNRPDFRATGKEWRTPPLWGIGLFQTVNNHTNYLHDGRARTLEEAILWHGGEAEKIIINYKKLSKVERNKLINFLKSL